MFILHGELINERRRCEHKEFINVKGKGERRENKREEAQIAYAPVLFATWREVVYFWLWNNASEE